MTEINVVIGNIVDQEVGALVNAANSSLLGGSGVDGAIHHAAGPDLLTECRSLNGCEAGEAKVTKGYRLKASYVIHTVGPIWQGGNQGEGLLLANCYRNSLGLARQLGIRSIAFPAISTGVYGYPMREAAMIATEVVTHLGSDPDFDLINLVCFEAAAAAHYIECLATLKRLRS